MEILNNYFQRLMFILSRPLIVLEEYKSEEGIEEPLKFVGVSIFITAIISFLFMVLQSMPLLDSIISLGKNVLYNLVYIFVVSGVFHLFVKLFKGPNPYYQTFKAFAYMSGFQIIVILLGVLSVYLPSLYVIFSIANFMLGLWVLILFVSALKLYVDLSSLKLVGVFLLSFIVLIGLYFVYFYVLLSRFI